MLRTRIRLFCGYGKPNYNLNSALSGAVPPGSVARETILLLSDTPTTAPGERFAGILVYRGDNIVESPSATKQPA
jgi:hypothetical protein